MGSGGSDDDDDAADDDKYHYSCDVTVSDDLEWAPDETVARSHSAGWCHSDLDDHVGCTASPGDCWEMCSDDYDDLVAIDWLKDGGSCYCQTACECMNDVGDSSTYLITRTDTTLPQECGPGEGADDDDDDDDADDDDGLITECGVESGWTQCFITAILNGDIPLDFDDDDDADADDDDDWSPGSCEEAMASEFFAEGCESPPGVCGNERAAFAECLMHELLAMGGLDCDTKGACSGGLQGGSDSDAALSGPATSFLFTFAAAAAAVAVAL